MGKSKIQPSSDEYVLDQLSIAEEKLLKLLEELDQSGKDLKDIQRQMEEEEVCVHIVFILSQYCDITRNRWRMKYVLLLCLYCLNIVILPETDGG